MLKSVKKDFLPKTNLRADEHDSLVCFTRTERDKLDLQADKEPNVRDKRN